MTRCAPMWDVPSTDRLLQAMSGAIEPSHVLRALGLSDEQARASIRFGLSRFTTGEDIDAAIVKVTDAVTQLRRRTF